MLQYARPALVVVLSALCIAPLAATVAADAPFTIVMTDGGRVAVLDLPQNTGKMTKIRTHPDGRFSSLPSARIDWNATKAANAAPAAPAAPTVSATPPGASSRLRALAGTLRVDEERANTAGDTMKLKSGKTMDMYEDGPYFGEKSVGEHLTAGALYFNAEGCPTQRAVFAGTVTNSSRKKLRGLRALVLLVERSTGRSTERIESIDPPNLAPGDEAQIFLYVSCDYARSSRSFVAVLKDISGTAEELAKPGSESPFAKPTATERK